MLFCQINDFFYSIALLKVFHMFFQNTIGKICSKSESFKDMIMISTHESKLHVSSTDLSDEHNVKCSWYT